MFKLQLVILKYSKNEDKILFGFNINYNPDTFLKVGTYDVGYSSTIGWKPWIVYIKDKHDKN